jgi:hypothetical protein
MSFGSIAFGVTAVLLYAFALIGLPILWASRQRTRRAAISTRQVALTDALDAAFGPVVTPVVEKPFRGPWVIRVAAPLMDARRMGQVIETIQTVLSSPGFSATPYQLVLSPAVGYAVAPGSAGMSPHPRRGREQAIAA